MAPLDAFVGLPWSDRGRTPEGCDCYGLALLVYRDVLGIALRTYDEPLTGAGTADHDRRFLEAERQRREFLPIPLGTERLYDVVLLRERPWHIGIVARRGWMLHMPVGQTSVMEQFTTGRHALRVEGVYRHASFFEMPT